MATIDRDGRAVHSFSPSNAFLDPAARMGGGDATGAVGARGFHKSALLLQWEASSANNTHPIH